MKTTNIIGTIFTIAPVIVLAFLAYAAYKKDYYNPYFVRDREGNPPEYPMPFITMWLCNATAGLDVVAAILGVLGVKISAGWSVLLIVIIIATVATELVPNIINGHNWRRMNWATVTLILINWVTFLVIASVY